MLLISLQTIVEWLVVLRLWVFEFYIVLLQADDVSLHSLHMCCILGSSSYEFVVLGPIVCWFRCMAGCEGIGATLSVETFTCGLVCDATQWKVSVSEIIVGVYIQGVSCLNIMSLHSITSFMIGMS
eukprot:gene13062-8908_t